MTKVTKITKVAVICLATGLSAGAVASTDSQQQTIEFAEKLATLRGEVQTLSDDIVQRQKSLQQRKTGMLARRAELQAEVRREKLKTTQLKNKIKQLKSGSDEISQDRAAQITAVKGTLAQVRTYIESSMPFKRSERAQELTKLNKQIDDKLMSPERAYSYLWSFFEDELRLTRENGLHRQVLEVGGEQILCDVAKLGMVRMYFKTPANEFGIVHRSRDGWVTEKFSNSKSEKQVADLMGAFKKQIRVGFYQLPNGTRGQL